MSVFALVSEGITDEAVLRNILIGWCKESGEEPFVNARQPDSCATGESSWQQFGNWENVLRWLSEKKHRDALEYADFLVVQIDTDQCDHKNFGVSQRESNQELSPRDLAVRVAMKLKEIIGESDMTFYGDKIILAICVREIECWLLPLWAKPKAAKTTGCIAALNMALGRANEPPINVDAKDPRLYAYLSRPYRKRKILDSEGRKNPSLSLFLDELDRRGFLPEEE